MSCCESLLYAVNTSSGTSVAVGGTIPITNVVRRYGRNINLEGNGITVASKCPGYYKVNVSSTMISTAAGPIAVSLYSNGNPVPGASGTVTASAASEYVNIAFPAVIKLNGCCQTSAALTLVLSGTAAQINNISVSVEKV